MYAVVKRDKNIKTSMIKKIIKYNALHVSAGNTYPVII